MITGDSGEGSAEHSDTNLRVRVEIEISKDNTPSAGAILQAAQNSLHGALTALGITSVDALIGAWHEDNVVEAREAGGF